MSLSFWAAPGIGVKVTGDSSGEDSLKGFSKMRSFFWGRDDALASFPMFISLSPSHWLFKSSVPLPPCLAALACPSTSLASKLKQASHSYDTDMKPVLFHCMAGTKMTWRWQPSPPTWKVLCLEACLMISFREKKRTSGDFQELIQHREKSKTVPYEMREMCVF